MPTDIHSLTIPRSSSWLVRPAQERPRSKPIADNILLVMSEQSLINSPDRIPQFVAYSDLPHTKNKIVACTQPRRVAATSVAKRVADEMDGPCFLGIAMA